MSVAVHHDDIVKRRTVTWDDMAAEMVQATMREEIEFRFRAQPCSEAGSLRDDYARGVAKTSADQKKIGDLVLGNSLLASAVFAGSILGLAGAAWLAKR